LPTRPKDLFTLETRWRMANRKRALAEDAKLLEDTRRLKDVDINSRNWQPGCVARIQHWLAFGCHSA
jgi:hypothetical protein